MSDVDFLEMRTCQTGLPSKGKFVLSICQYFEALIFGKNFALKTENETIM